MRLHGFLYKISKKLRNMHIQLHIVRLHSFLYVATISHFSISGYWNRYFLQLSCNLCGIRHHITQKVPEMLWIKVVFLRLRSVFKIALSYWYYHKSLCDPHHFMKFHGLIVLLRFFLLKKWDHSFSCNFCGYKGFYVWH